MGVLVKLKVVERASVGRKRVLKKIDKGTDRAFKYYGKAVYRGIRRKYGSVAKGQSKARKAPKAPKARQEPGLRTIKTPIKYRGKTPLYVVAGPIRFAKSKVNGKTVARLHEEGGRAKRRMISLRERNQGRNRKGRFKKKGIEWIWDGSPAAQRIKSGDSDRPLVWQTKLVRWPKRPTVAPVGKEKRKAAMAKFRGMLRKV